MSDQGTLVRTRVDEVSIIGRNAQGVKLIRVSEGEKLVGIARVEEPVLDDAVVVEQDAGATDSTEA